MTSVPITLLLVDDDADDREMTADALRESRLANDLHFVNDGQELLDYLRREGAHADPASSPRPSLILLDLNMPRMDGREALAVIKKDPTLKRIPIVILTTSRADEDICSTYDLGVNSYISKPVSFEGLVQAMKSVGRYWFELVELPPVVAEDA
ncbi:MAG: response regulator [Gemmatimonadaceae bacterium]